MCSIGGMGQTEEREGVVAEGIRCSCGPRSEDCCFNSSISGYIIDPKRSMVEISCQPYGPCMFSSTMSFAPRSSLLGLFILVRQSVELLCMKNYDPHSQEQSSFYVLFNISPMGEKKRDKRFGYQAFLSVYVQYHNFRNLWTWCFKSSATNDYSTLSKLIIHIYFRWILPKKKAISRHTQV